MIIQQWRWWLSIQPTGDAPMGEIWSSEAWNSLVLTKEGVIKVKMGRDLYRKLGWKGKSEICLKGDDSIVLQGVFITVILQQTEMTWPHASSGACNYRIWGAPI